MMRKTLFALLLLTLARPVFAGELRLDFQNGFVTLSAKDVPVRQILQEWSRKGQTRVVNAERVIGGPVTIQLTHMPEDKALDIVLRSVAGYMAAPRAVPIANASSYDRILVMATSSAAPAAARTGAPAGYTPPPVFQPPMQGPNVPPGGAPAAAMPEGQGEGGMPPGFVPDTDDSDQPVSPPLVQQDGEVAPGPPNQNGVPAPGTVPQGVPGLQQQTGAPEQGPDQQAQQPPPPPGPTPLQPGVVTTTGPGQVPAPENQQQQVQPQPEQ